MSAHHRALLIGILLALLPSRSKAEPQPANVSTENFVLNITPGQFSSFSAERMVALADGTRLVLGSGAGNSANAEFLLKLNPNGTQAWAISVADPFTAVFTGLAADAVGNAYVAYTDFSNFAEPHARIVKFNASGSETARADLATEAGGDGFPFSAGIAVDSVRGRVYAAHSFFSSTQGQDTFAVTAFDAALQRVAGPLIHDPGFTGSFIGPDPKGGTLVDGSGQVWVAGLRLVPGASSAELFAAHYGPNLAGGAVAVLPSQSAEEVSAVADPRGGVVVAGDRRADDNLYLHRVAAGGFGPAYRFEGFDAVASPMAVDPAGSLYVIGFHPTTFLPAVAKINASNVLAWDQPGPYLNLPDTLFPGAVAAASSTTFDVAGVAFNVTPSPVVLLHYQQQTSEQISLNLTLNPMSVRPGTKTKLTVQLVNAAGSPLGEQRQVEVSAAAIPTSGGHDHGGARPAGIFNGNGVIGSNPSLATSDADGKLTVDYTASEFGGAEILQRAL